MPPEDNENGGGALKPVVALVNSLAGALKHVQTPGGWKGLSLLFIVIGGLGLQSYGAAVRVEFIVLAALFFLIVVWFTFLVPFFVRYDKERGTV